MRKVLPMDRVEYLTFSAIDRRYLKIFPIFGFTLEVVIHDPAPWHEPRLSISPERKKKRGTDPFSISGSIYAQRPPTRGKRFRPIRGRAHTVQQPLPCLLRELGSLRGRMRSEKQSRMGTFGYIACVCPGFSATTLEIRPWKKTDRHGAT